MISPVSLSPLAACLQEPPPPILLLFPETPPLPVDKIHLALSLSASQPSLSPHLHSFLPLLTRDPTATTLCPERATATKEWNNCPEKTRPDYQHLETPQQL